MIEMNIFFIASIYNIVNAWQNWKKIYPSLSVCLWCKMFFKILILQWEEV